MSGFSRFPIRSFRRSHLWGLFALFFVATSCHYARLEGHVEGVDSDTLLIEKQFVSYKLTTDTLVTRPDGRFSCKLQFDSPNPEFYYLTYHGMRLASLLVKRGDKIRVEADTLGRCVIEGSDESVRMMDSDREYAKINNRCHALSLRLQDLPQNTKHAASLRREYYENYLKLYRSSVRYIVENSRSLTSVPVIFRKLGDLPVFNQRMDALHYRSLADSLAAVYPTSPYVRALQKEASARMKQLDFSGKIDSVAVVGFPEIELPDIRSEKVKLSSVEGKVVLLHFWTSTDGVQKVFNQDVLKPLYQKYHTKGLNIYQVALDTDKFGWAQVVKAQKMPWVNVCDIRGGASTNVMLYNVANLPTTYVIADGEMYAEQPADAQSLRKIVDKILK
ncbi:MAG: AhpC/TSA family protein [Bacteroidales bacterium]|nr:AhpC/TSA family protein [Bacteroidales bacterium]